MKSNRTHSSVNPAHSIQFRRTVIAIASVIAVGGMTAGVAHAQSATYGLTFPGTQSVPLLTGYQNNYNRNAQSTPASIGANINNVFTGATLVNGPNGTPVTVTNNSSAAQAVGNLFDPGQIDLPLMLFTNGSAGILSGQLRGTLVASPTITTASQSGVKFGAVEIGMVAAPITITGNTLSASTTLNEARSIMRGDIPIGYVSAAPGSVIAGYTTGGISTTTSGSVGISSQQASLNAGARAGSIATIDTSKITLDLMSTTSGAASSPLTLSSNTLEVDYSGNVASNSFSATAAQSPSFTGSVAVNNAQANIESQIVDPTVATALVTTSSITADIRNRAAGRTDLSNALSVNDNVLTASSAGNTAGSRGTTLTPGNEIVFAPGVDVMGTGSATSNSMTNGASTLAVNLGADLVLMNGQGNQGTRFTSQVSNGKVTVQADNLAAGGSISASGNGVASLATGNLAVNRISTDSTNLNATAAAANSQSNDATPIRANTFFGEVTVGVGKSGTPVSGPITANGNAIDATAEGSAAATAVNLQATYLTALLPGGASSGALSDTNGFGAVNTLSGASANNLQGNYGASTPIAATVLNSYVAVNVKDQTNNTTLVPLSAATVTLDRNQINARAAGNSAGTAVALSGTNASAQASVGNTQFNGNNVSADVIGSGITATSGGVGTASTVTLTNSTVAASAVANDANNAVRTDVTKLSTGLSSIGFGLFTASSNGVVARSNANFGIASGQRNEASVSSTNVNSLAAGAGSSAAIYAGETGVAGVANSTLTASDNRVTSDTTGNRVENTLSIATSSLETLGNAATQIGGIASLQVNQVAGVANATVGGNNPAVTRAGITYAGSVTTSDLTASGNTVASKSVGNDATNKIGVLGGASLVSLAPANGTGLVSSSAGTVQNEFGLVNRQSDSVSGGRTATTQFATVGISNAGGIPAISGSNLTADDNHITAEARNNAADNAINLAGFATLSSGAGMLNLQSSDTAVAANVTEGRLRIRTGNAPTVRDSNLVMDRNSVDGLAVGSSASNRLIASAANLSGNARLTTSGVTPLNEVTADYGIANNQSQNNTVSSLVSTPIRIVGGNSVVVDSNLTLSNNKVTGVAQATSASNDLRLNGSGGVTGVTGAVGSLQQTSGAVTATVTPETGGANTASIDALTMTGTAVTVSGNTVLASAGQNEAFNTQQVTGAGVSGRALANSTDFSVSNQQRATAGDVTAQTLPVILGVQTNRVDSGSVTVSGNTIRANANSNNSGNGLDLVAASSVAATAAVSNDQSALAGVVSSTVGATNNPTTVGVAPATAGATTFFTGTSVTVSGNTLASTAGRNSTINALNVAAANIAGGVGAVQTNDSFQTLNTQQAQGDVTATTVLGVVGATVYLGLSTEFTVSGNTVTSSANGNDAKNTQTLKAVGTLAGSGLVSNDQVSGGFTPDLVSATIAGATGGAATVGLAQSLSGVAFSGGPIAVSGNTLTAQAGRNSAQNALDAKASVLTGDAADPSFAVVSTQSAVGGVSASNTLGVVGATANSATNNTFTVSKNTVAAEANSNTASNVLGMTAVNTLSGSGIADNVQSASGGVVSASVTTGAVGVVGVAIDNSPITVSGNTLSADASRNVATNAVNVKGSTVNGDITALNNPSSFVARNVQTGSGNVTASNLLGVIGVTENSAVNTPLTVAGNIAASSANVNVASNTVSLNAVSALTGTGQVINTQTAGNPIAPDTAVSAVTGGASNASRATVGVTAFSGPNTLNASPVTVSGNSVLAQGAGNTALNALEATSVGSIGGSAFPTFAILNVQNNYASVDTKVQFINAGATGSLTATNAVVQANQMAASSYGNSASNSLGLSALGNQNTASAMISNVQFNGAAITSSVNSVNIGVFGSASGGSVVVSGNSVSARSVGNSASNVISAR